MSSIKNCCVCGKDFTNNWTSDQINQHINRCLDSSENNNEPSPQLTCPICRKSFKTQRSKTTHLKKCAKNFAISPLSMVKLLEKNKPTQVIKKAIKKQKISKYFQPIKSDSFTPPEPKKIDDDNLQLAKALSMSIKRGPSRKPFSKDSEKLPFYCTEDQEIVNGRIRRRISMILTEDNKVESGDFINSPSRLWSMSCQQPFQGVNWCVAESPFVGNVICPDSLEEECKSDGAICTEQKTFNFEDDVIFPESPKLCESQIFDAINCDMCESIDISVYEAENDPDRIKPKIDSIKLELDQINPKFNPNELEFDQNNSKFEQTEIGPNRQEVDPYELKFDQIKPECEQFEPIFDQFKSEFEQFEPILDQSKPEFDQNKSPEMCQVEPMWMGCDEDYGLFNFSFDAPVPQPFTSSPVVRHVTPLPLAKRVRINMTPSTCKTPPRRVNNPHPSEFSPFTPLPDYNAMRTPELTNCGKNFGLRKMSRKRMVLVLRDIYRQTHRYRLGDGAEISALDIDKVISGCIEPPPVLEESSFYEGDPCSEDEPCVEDDGLENKIITFVLANDDLYSKILLYEPLDIYEFKNSLTSAENPVKCNLVKLMNIMDRLGIIFTLKSKRQEGRHKFHGLGKRGVFKRK